MMIHKVKQLLPHPLKIKPLDKDCDTYKIVIKNAGFKKAKESYVKQNFRCSLVKLFGEDFGEWAVRDSISRLKKSNYKSSIFNNQSKYQSSYSDPDSLAEYITESWEYFLDSIPIEYEILFSALSRLKGLSFVWNAREPIVEIFNIDLPSAYTARKSSLVVYYDADQVAMGAYHRDIIIYPGPYAGLYPGERWGNKKIFLIADSTCEDEFVKFATGYLNNVKNKYLQLMSKNEKNTYRQRQ